MKSDIRSLSEEDIKSFLLENNEKAFRAKQINQWLWQKNANSFQEMSNLSKSLRELLENHFTINKVALSETQISSDKTIKCAFTLFDDNVVEGVLIPTTDRMTACISTQVGCSLSCKFCATGKLKRLRNLTASEIVDQVVEIRDLANNNYQAPLSNIVYMGMGEPLLNYKETIRSIEKITSPDGLGMSPKRITVSTAGIAKMIKKLADDKVRFNLALSLHAANDRKRDEIMPINEQNNIEALVEALDYFYSETKNQITLEYIIFRDFNDSLMDAHELLQVANQIRCKINIIEYNPIDDGKFQKALPKKTNAFAEYLNKKGIPTTIRRSRGKDIDAACGQLANKNKVSNIN